MSYIISNDCVACQKCTRVCPAGAIYFDGELFTISQDKCISCGKCAEVCHIQAIHANECQEKAASDDYQEKAVNHELTAKRNLEQTCDFLVIGSGPAGLCAAVRMAEPENVFALQDTPFGKMVDMKPGKASAPYVTEKYIERAKELGVVFYTETQAKELKIEQNQIKSVTAQNERGTMTIFYRACMIATGNMSASDQIGRFVPEYAKAAHNRNAHRMPANTGDGIAMAENAGITIDEKGVACHYLGAMPPFFDGDVLKQGMRGEGVRVNLNGERFVSECVDRFEAVTLLLQQPQTLSYNIIDANILEQDGLPTIKLRTDIAGNLALGIPQEGKSVPMIDFMGFPVMTDENGKPLPSPLLDIGDQNNLVVDKKKSVLERLKSYVSLKNRVVCVADTIEELAGQMGVDPQKLKNTITHYNEMCERGCDYDFAKYPRYMIPIEKAPYIAIKCYLGSDGAFGGLFINENCQVMNDGIPVEGLYAGGDVTSGNFLKEHNRRLEIINDYTWANASGFIASRHAAGYLKTV